MPSFRSSNQISISAIWNQLQIESSSRHALTYAAFESGVVYVCMTGLEFSLGPANEYAGMVRFPGLRMKLNEASVKFLDPI